MLSLLFKYKHVQILDINRMFLGSIIFPMATVYTLFEIPSIESRTIVYFFVCKLLRIQVARAFVNMFCHDDGLTLFNRIYMDFLNGKFIIFSLMVGLIGTIFFFFNIKFINSISYNYLILF